GEPEPRLARDHDQAERRRAEELPHPHAQRVSPIAAAQRGGAEYGAVNSFRFVIPSEARDLLFVGNSGTASEQQIPRFARDDKSLNGPRPVSASLPARAAAPEKLRSSSQSRSRSS